MIFDSKISVGTLHWLAFPNQVLKNLYKFQFPNNFEYIIDHISEKWKLQKFETWFCIQFKTLRILWDKKKLVNFSDIFVNSQRILNTKSINISKTKNLKIVFTEASKHCATFWNENLIWPLLKGGEVCCMSGPKNT